MHALLSKEIHLGNTHTKLLVFSSLGKVYSIRSFEIPDSSLKARGKHIINLLPFSSKEKIATFLPLPIDEKEWNNHLTVNLTIPFLLIKYAMPLIKKNKGSIVNVGSIEGIGSNPNHPAYGSSKAGLHGLTRAVSVDHGCEAVRCNAVAPGWIDTKLNIDFVNNINKKEEFMNKLKNIHPIGRTGSPIDVAQLICWLASEEASFVTGQVWTIDGGRMTKLSLP